MHISFAGHYCLTVLFQACLSLQSSRWSRENVRSSTRAGLSVRGQRKWTHCSLECLVNIYCGSAKHFYQTAQPLRASSWFYCWFTLENACQEASQNTDEMFWCTAVTGGHGRHLSKDPTYLWQLLTLMSLARSCRSGDGKAELVIDWSSPKRPQGAGRMIYISWRPGWPTVSSWGDDPALQSASCAPLLSLIANPGKPISSPAWLCIDVEWFKYLPVFKLSISALSSNKSQWCVFVHWLQIAWVEEKWVRLRLLPLSTLLTFCLAYCMACGWRKEDERLRSFSWKRVTTCLKCFLSSAIPIHIKVKPLLRGDRRAEEIIRKIWKKRLKSLLLMHSVLYFVPILPFQSLLVFLTVIFIVFLWNRDGVSNYQGKACCRLVERDEHSFAHFSVFLFYIKFRK